MRRKLLLRNVNGLLRYQDLMLLGYGVGEEVIDSLVVLDALPSFLGGIIPIGVPVQVPHPCSFCVIGMWAST